MFSDPVPILMGIIILVSYLISLRFGISVALIEILLGALFGNFGVIYTEEWMLYSEDIVDINNQNNSNL